MSAGGALTTAFYAAPQFPEDARRLLDGALSAVRWDRAIEGPVRPGRGLGSSLVLAREWGMTELDERLSAAAEAYYGPTWDLERREFTWTMGLDEDHPRGQFNAFMAAAEAAGEGRWSALAAGPVTPMPQIVGVDFPEMALRRAEWINGHLFVGLAPRHEDPSRRTSFRITGVEPRMWELLGIDGASMDVTARDVLVRVPMVNADIEFVPSSY